MFDESVVEAFRETTLRTLARHPELESVAIAFSYRGQLNNTQGVHHGLWLGAGGSVTAPAEMLKSAEQTAMLLQFMFERVGGMLLEYKTQTTEAAAELLRLKEQIREYEAKKIAIETEGVRPV